VIFNIRKANNPKVKLTSIPTGNLKLDGGSMFGIIPKVLWSKVYPADENNLCNFTMRSLLVETGERKILIENGIGDKQDEKFMRNYFVNGGDSIEKSLARIGLTTDDITDMFLTHLHFDHCGGSIKYNEDHSKLVPAFKNATYWISERQWQCAVNPNYREKGSFLKENILPIKESGQLELITKEGWLMSDIDVLFVNGHTEGQAIPFIHYNDKTVVFVADLLPSTAHIPMPWIMAYDIRPLLSIVEKEVFLKEALEKKYILYFYHDLYHECCDLQMTEKGIREKKSYSINEI
jgi:glyoxylase-like metal-dependent hydrolase (beta-lactamase superfamily II)